MNTPWASYSPSFQESLKRYAELVVRHGLNVQPGQLVNITAEVAHRLLVSCIVEAAYRHGASFVNFELIDPINLRNRILVSDEKHLAHVPRFVTSKFDELVEVEGANLKIIGPEYPDYLSDLNPTGVNEVRKANYQAARNFYAQGIERSKVHWCVIAAATPAWAERIFPELKGAQAEERLWGEIFKICRVDSPDFMERWKVHNQRLWDRAKQLTDLRIRELHFTGPGSDLRVGLSPVAIFKGGSDRTPSGTHFEPNLPTEECFTTPDWRKTEGVVKATRPFYVNGNLIRDLVLTFKNGVIGDFSCSEGRATLEAYLASDEGAKRLGEVALVGIDSPVYASGVVFQEILYDENAACHIAVGSAYKGCLQGGGELSAEQRAEIGCNDSTVHTDIMISSEDVDVVALLESGEKLQLISRGRWVGVFSV